MLQKNINLSNLAPIVLFTYNRPWHTKQTIEALQKNELAKESELFIFSDGGKDEASWEKVNEVREYLKTINSFKKVILTFQDKNIGLADSIISGVTKIVNQYGKIIVLEDDIVTSPYFLRFMNDTLDFYQYKNEIWQTSGWFYPIEVDDLDDIIVHRAMNCLAWGTWHDRWQYFEKDSNNLINIYSKNDIRLFNMNNSKNNWNQVILNFNGIINTWAVFWHEVVFRNKGLYISPKNSIVENIGFDGSGTHNCELSIFDNKIKKYNYNFAMNNNISENKIAMDRIKLLYFESFSNQNILFSSNINKVFQYLNKLNIMDCSFILYGSGTGMELVLCRLEKNKILFAIDQDELKYNTIKNNIKIINLTNFKNIDDKKTKIIITVFGRANKIQETLINEYKIDKSRIISLDILDE
ncbi:glycosyltransferase [Aliarcobacter cryaerophilus]|uniref:glycosyltransferase n=1 Tax=Aliarcobacter cryaerophilus TaxID=28198 RepID=UPI00112F70DB|nr:glycosyltransferase [Aliarcobacter cryaerophilus]